MAVLKNRAKMSTSTTGTGTITLGSAEDGYQTFADAGVANADVVRYVIEDTGGAFEIGTGTYTSSGTTLSRTVSESSNSNNAINLSGSATVFIGATAEDIELSGNMAGDISSNGHAIKLGDRTGSGANELIMGAGDDFKLYHNGATGHSIISETGSGNLQIAATNIELKADSGHALLTATYGGSVDLYHNSSKKAETTSSGLQTTGTLNVNGAYTLPTSDGTNGQVLTTDGSGAVTFADAGGGGGADLYAANESSPSAQPSATGANAVAIGDSAVASGVDAAAIGNLATATGYRAFAGPKSRAGGQESVALGIGSTNTSYGAPQNFSQAIGLQAYASTAESTAIGNYAASSGTRSVALAKSYASGASSFAAAIDNNTSSYGATGANSIAIGQNAKATNGLSVGLGYGVNASAYGSLCVSYNSSTSGNYSSVLGGISSTASATKSSVVNGDTSLAGHTSSTAIGPYSTTRAQYAFAFGGQSFDAQGAGQASIFNLVSDTTDATAEAMTTNKSTASTNNQVILPNNSAYAFHGTIVARQQAADGTACAAWKVEGLIRREANAGTTVLVNSATTVLDNTPNWGMALSADTTNGGLAITCTGAASTDIRWVATIHTSEVTYA